MTAPRNGISPSGSATIFPKAYLLSIYTAAIEQGYVWVHPIKEADAVSLRQSLYRLRRHSDTSNKGFITPDHHLVTVGAWEEGPAGTGRLPVMYSELPAGQTLPSITPASGVDMPSLQPPPAAPHLPPEQLLAASQMPPALTSDDFLLSPGDIDSFVGNMISNVTGADDDADD